MARSLERGPSEQSTENAPGKEDFISENILTRADTDSLERSLGLVKRGLEAGKKAIEETQELLARQQVTQERSQRDLAEIEAELEKRKK